MEDDWATVGTAGDGVALSGVALSRVSEAGGCPGDSQTRNVAVAVAPAVAGDARACHLVSTKSIAKTSVHGRTSKGAGSDNNSSVYNGNGVP